MLPEVVYICKLLRWHVCFDGCSVGLTSHSGEPLLKPWKVATTLPALQDPLSRCTCGGGQPHGVTRGDDAVRSSFYTPALVD
eukprot:15314195-Heterocapsa_arctica.AAC.1